MTRITRRQIIQGAGAVAAAALAKPALATPAWITGKPFFVDYPFKLGVASGDPLPTGFVIWTRLAPVPLDPNATGGDPIPVQYEVARDRRFRDVVRKGGTVAYPENGHSIHVVLENLEAGRDYFYRFMAGGEVSPVGRAITTPAVMSPTDRFKIAVASCQHFEEGYFKAYRDMVAQDPDLIMHLGDYIYEFSYNSPLRRMPVDEARSLNEYRSLHAVHKLDEDLQAAHRHTSWVFTWDDHEVANDYAADQDENYEDPKTFLMRRAAAYKAYYEHMPLRSIAQPRGADMRLYQRLWVGDLIEINMLDTRQYRTDQPCQTPDNGGWRQIPGECSERHDQTRTILGAEQERWLNSYMGRRNSKWHLIAQGMLFSQHDYKVGEGSLYGSEYWDGYTASRDRLLNTFEYRKVSNPVILGGDVHATYVCDVKKDFNNPDSATVASEFVATSISSSNHYHSRNLATIGENPHIKHYDGSQRGYTLCEFTKDKMVVDNRVVDDVTKKEMKAKTATRWVVEDGKPGPQKA